MPGGDTHGHFFNPPYHTVMRAGQGCHLTDVDGNRYIDCVNAYFVLIHGHCFPPVVSALEQQIRRGTAFGMPTEDQMAFAHHLCERVPSLDRVRFVASGSEATNMTIRAARAFTGKQKIMKVDGGYHGTHNIGELNSFGASERGRSEAMPALGARGSEIDDVILFPWNNEAVLKQIILEKAEEIAVLIIEPILVVGGVIIPEPGFLETVRALTRDNGIILVFDEVVTLPFSYGGMQSQYGITPDLTAMGKGIGGGLPIGAWGGRTDIMEMWDPQQAHDKAVVMVSTFGGNALTMSAGLAAMTHLTESMIDKRNKLADRLREGINAVFKNLRIMGHASGTCNAFWIHWADQTVRDPYDAVDAMQNATDRIRNLLFMGMRYRGVYFFPSPSPFGNVSTAMEEKDIDHIINAFDDTLKEIRPMIEKDSPVLLT
jgi:glutamate-1-semialdehyde 2,1-aminomutase